MTAPAERLPLVGRDGGCEHLRAVAEPQGPRSASCEECGATARLRICLECGHVGCCDSRQGHASAHAAETGHLLIRAWKGGAFVYCFDHGYL